MSIVDFITPAIEHSKNAKECENKNDYKGAYEYYIKSCEYLVYLHITQGIGY